MSYLKGYNKYILNFICVNGDSMFHDVPFLLQNRKTMYT